MLKQDVKLDAVTIPLEVYISDRNTYCKTLFFPMPFSISPFITLLYVFVTNSSTAIYGDTCN
jgi:hypothetical protein